MMNFVTGGQHGGQDQEEARGTAPPHDGGRKPCSLLLAAFQQSQLVSAQLTRNNLLVPQALDSLDESWETNNNKFCYEENETMITYSNFKDGNVDLTKKVRRGGQTCSFLLAACCLLTRNNLLLHRATCTARSTSVAQSSMSRHPSTSCMRIRCDLSLKNDDF